MGSAHCGNGALPCSLAAFCGYLECALGYFFLWCTWQKSWCTPLLFLVCLATFFRIGKPHSMDFGSTSGPQFCAQKIVASPIFWVQHPAFFECNIHLFLRATSTHQSKVASISEGEGGGTGGAGLCSSATFFSTRGGAAHKIMGGALSCQAPRRTGPAQNVIEKHRKRRRASAILNYICTSWRKAPCERFSSFYFDILLDTYGGRRPVVLFVRILSGNFRQTHLANLRFSLMRQQF